MVRIVASTPATERAGYVRPGDVVAPSARGQRCHDIRSTRQPLTRLLSVVADFHQPGHGRAVANGSTERQPKGGLLPPISWNCPSASLSDCRLTTRGATLCLTIALRELPLHIVSWARKPRTLAAAEPRTGRSETVSVPSGPCCTPPEPSPRCARARTPPCPAASPTRAWQ